MTKIGGVSSGLLSEEILRERSAADVTHIGSECELSLKIPGKEMTPFSDKFFYYFCFYMFLYSLYNYSN